MYAFLSFHQCLEKLKVILKKFNDANSNILSIPEFISAVCFPCSSVSKESPALQDIWDRFLDWEDPMEEKWQPIPVFLPGKSHGQRSQADYMASQESDMTYQLTTTTTILTFGSGSFSSFFAYVCQIIFIKWQTLYVWPEKRYLFCKTNSVGPWAGLQFIVSKVIFVTCRLQIFSNVVLQPNAYCGVLVTEGFF